MNIATQLGILVIVFLLALILGLQIQITGLDREIKDLKRRLSKHHM